MTWSEKFATALLRMEGGVGKGVGPILDSGVQKGLREAGIQPDVR